MTDLPKHAKYDFSQKRPALTPVETQDAITNKALDLVLLSLQLVTLQAGGTVIKSTSGYRDVSLYPIVSQETSEGIAGPYVSRVVYADAYYKIEVDYAENGSEIRRVETKLE
jgi:hypothetical protein